MILPNLDDKLRYAHKFLFSQLIQISSKIMPPIVINKVYRQINTRSTTFLSETNELFGLRSKDMTEPIYFCMFRVQKFHAIVLRSQFTSTNLFEKTHLRTGRPQIFCSQHRTRIPYNFFELWFLFTDL